MAPRYASDWQKANKAAAATLAPDVDLPEEVEVRTGRKPRLEVRERTPYGTDSEHSWVLDRAASANRGIAPTPRSGCSVSRRRPRSGRSAHRRSAV